MPAKFEKIVTPITSGKGPIRVQLEYYGSMLAMYQAKARNAIVRDAMWQGGEYYRNTFVPLKFTNYARKYGYHIGSRYLDRKRKLFGVDIPLVFSDIATHNGLRSQVLGNSRTEARATASTATATIRLPGPAYMNATQAVYTTLRTILPEEMERVATIVGAALAENLEGTTSKRGGAAPLRKLTPGQEAKFSRSLPAQRGRSAPGAGSRKVA